jgi:hypothetical protein
MFNIASDFEDSTAVFRGGSEVADDETLKIKTRSETMIQVISGKCDGRKRTKMITLRMTSRLTE